jgi:hypothetical protein
MIFSEVPNAIVDRGWRNISVLISNRFRVRCLSKDNQFRVSIGIGFSGPDGIPIILSQKTAYVQFAAWQEVRVPLSLDYKGVELFIYARISDVQWGARGQTSFLLLEGESMIYDSASASDVFKTNEVVEELHGVHGPTALLAAGAMVSIPANLKRRRGFIWNNYTNPVFVYFSGTPVPAGSVDRNTARVAKGSRIDIPEGYTGVITVDVKGQFSVDTGLLASVQYLAANAV